MTKREYFEKEKFIWQNFVPKSGQAEFIQGELLRAIVKIRDEAQRNANVNFSEKCHKILIEFLRDVLCDERIFNKKDINQINIDLDRLLIDNQPYTFNDIFDRIKNRVVDWYLIYEEPIPHKKNDDLYC